jgi:hypothetical protein
MKSEGFSNAPFENNPAWLREETHPIAAHDPSVHFWTGGETGLISRHVNESGPFPRRAYVSRTHFVFRTTLSFYGYDFLHLKFNVPLSVQSIHPL